jgi:hypothetical protein
VLRHIQRGKRSKRRFGRGVASGALGVAARPQCGRPVGFDCDRIEATLLDQALGELDAQPIELARAVRRLAEKHPARLADLVQERVDIAQPAQRMSVAADDVGVAVVGGHAEDAATAVPDPRSRSEHRRSSRGAARRDVLWMGTSNARPGHHPHERPP